MGLLLGASVITVFEALDLLLYNGILKCLEVSHLKRLMNRHKGTVQHQPILHNEDLNKTRPMYDNSYRGKDGELTLVWRGNPAVPNAFVIFFQSKRVCVLTQCIHPSDCTLHHSLVQTDIHGGPCNRGKQSQFYTFAAFLDKCLGIYGHSWFPFKFFPHF